MLPLSTASVAISLTLLMLRQFGNVTSLAALCTSVESVSSSTASALGLTVAAATSKGRVLLLNVTEERSALGGDRRHGCGAIPTHWIWRVMADVALSDKTAEPPVLSTLTPALAAAGRVAPSLRHSKDLSDHHRSSTALTGRDRMTSIENASYKKGAGPELANHLAAIPDKDKRCDNEYFMSFVVRNDGNLNIYDWGETISTDNARRSIGDIRGLLLRHRSCGEPYLAMVEKSTLSPKRRPTREMPTGGKIPAQRVAQLPAEDENRAPKAVNRITSYGNSQRASSSKQTAKEFIKSISRTSGIESKQATETAGMSSSTAGPAASTSIFDISTGTQFEKGSSKMSKAKLMYFLDKNERYPDAYRPLIWRYLLQLPENAAAFAELVKRGTHPAYSSKTLARKYPLESSRLFSKLQGMCSHLAHWSSIFGEASYVPQLCFPFVLIYDNDELAALETVMSLLMWWGYSWHVCHPNPPAQLTDTFDALLLHHDPTLHKHLKSLELSPGLISWRLTYSVYSEFLSKESWLRVMDFVFTNFESLELMALLPIALIRLSSASLLCSYNTDHILKFFSSQQDLKASSIVNMTKHMLAKTPKPMLLACYRGAKSRSHDTFVSNKADITDLNGAKRVAYNQHGRKDGRDGLPGAKNRSSSRRHDEASMRGSDLDDELASWRATAGESVRQSLAAQAGAPVFPLPRERYPAYDGYPQAMIDWELRKRSVQMALDDELECREDVLRELEKRIEEVRRTTNIVQLLKC